MSALSRRILRKALPVTLCLLPNSTNAQLNATAAISLTARLPGTVRVREPLIPFLITVSGSQQRTSPVQFEVTWNLDPRETQSFRITATNSSKGQQSAKLSIRVDNSDFRYFSANSRVVLINVPIRAENRQGRQTHTLELLFDPAEGGLLDGEYRGILTLTVEQQ